MGAERKKCKVIERKGWRKEGGREMDEGIKRERKNLGADRGKLAHSLPRCTRAAVMLWR